MAAYFFRRLLLIFPTFVGITLLVFVITRMVPGGPIERAIAEARQATEGVQNDSGNVMQALSEDQINQLREYYGFDKPIIESYVLWLMKVVRLDLGESTRYGEPVWEAIKARLPVSTYFGVVSLLLTYLICIPLGIFKALKHNTVSDNVSSFVVFTGYAIPSYAVAIILLVAFASTWEIFPLGGLVSDEFEDMSLVDQAADLFMHSVLPMTAYVAGNFAVMTFLMKNSLMDNLAAEYVRTAIAKGLDFKSAVVKHGLRNSLIPLATHFGNNISVVLSGSFLIEKIFDIDGFGLLGYEAVVERDYPVVMGILVLSAMLQLVGNILSDLCVAFVDPRVQFE